MLPPMLRDRTVSPNTWPIVRTTRVPGMFSVVVTIIDGLAGAAACMAASSGPRRRRDQRSAALSIFYQNDITFLPTGPGRRRRRRATAHPGKASRAAAAGRDAAGDINRPD